MAKVNSATILLAFMAVMFGLVGTYVLKTALRQPTPVVKPAPSPPQKPERITVPLASRDIPSGTQITLDDVALYRMTRDEIKESLQVSSFMTNPDQIVGKILLRNLKRGKTFNTRDFYPVGTSPGIAKRLKSGQRAITLMLEPTDALLGFAGAGQNVDVLFHYGAESDQAGNPNLANRNNTQNNSDNGRFYPQHHDFNPPRRRDYYGNTIGGGSGGNSGSGFSLDNEFYNATVTLVQNAQIMALGRKSMPTDAASGLPLEELVPVTLAVSPREAEMLKVADGHGTLSLTLRGPQDAEQVRLLDPVTLNEIIDIKSQVHKMVIHRGKSVSTLQFAGGVKIQKKVHDHSASGQDQVNRGQHPSPLPMLNVVSPYYFWPPFQPVNGPTVDPVQRENKQPKSNLGSADRNDSGERK